MTPEERDRMNLLCARISEEKDPDVFDKLVRELSELISVKSDRIHPHSERE